MAHPDKFVHDYEAFEATGATAKSYQARIKSALESQLRSLACESKHGRRRAALWPPAPSDCLQRTQSNTQGTRTSMIAHASERRGIMWAGRRKSRSARTVSRVSRGSQWPPPPPPPPHSETRSGCPPPYHTYPPPPPYPLPRWWPHALRRPRAPSHPSPDRPHHGVAGRIDFCVPPNSVLPP